MSVTLFALFFVFVSSSLNEGERGLWAIFCGVFLVLLSGMRGANFSFYAYMDVGCDLP